MFSIFLSEFDLTFIVLSLFWVNVLSEDFPFLPRVVAIEKDRKFADFYALGEEIGK